MRQISAGPLVLRDRATAWYLNVAEDLREAMARNPALKVFVANGYYDLAAFYRAAGG